jgi:MFS family permease
MNVTFDFLRENLKPLLKFSFYVILPVCLIQSFCMDTFMRVYMSLFDISDINIDFVVVAGYYVLVLLCTLLGSVLLSALVCSLMQTYERRDRRLEGLVFADFRASFVTNCVKVAKILLFTFGVFFAAVAILSLLAWMSPWTLVLTVLLLLAGSIAFMVPVSLLTPLYLFEDLSFADALRKSMKYGFSAWGETFLVLLVFGLLANIVGSMTSIPWTLVTIVGSVFSLASPDAGIASSIWYRFLTYILGVIMAYGTYVSVIVSVGGTAFQYFHLREKREGVTMKTDIANFDRL